MAEGKKGFVLYSDLIHTVKKMPKDKAGELFLTILEYVNDEDPTISDILVDLVFEPIKQQLKRDLVKYEEKKKQYSDAGKASAEARRLKKDQLYIIECFDNKERFLKVGVTSESISRRYGSTDNPTKAMPYQYKVIAQYSYNKGELSPSELESKIYKKFKDYLPRIKFGGYLECKNIEDIEDIIDFIFEEINDARCLTVFNDVEVSSTNSTVIVNDSVSVNVSVKEKEIKEIYSYYPSKCPIGGRSTGKTSKNKDKIKGMLKNMSKDDLINRIELYISDCKKTNTYIKNFGSFLNNLPDIEESKLVIKSIDKKLFVCMFKADTNKYVMSDEDIPIHEERNQTKCNQKKETNNQEYINLYLSGKKKI